MAKSDGMVVLVGIDGDAAAGKTTLTKQLAAHYNCPAIHMDHFFLPPDLRTEERLAEAGGNVDYQRFDEEVLQPLIGGKTFTYRPFDCAVGDFGQVITVRSDGAGVVVVEGAYALHPRLAHAYHVKVFMAIKHEEQMKRIIARNGAEMAEKFRDIWIPMEKRYHATFGVKQSCHIAM